MILLNELYNHFFNSGKHHMVNEDMFEEKVDKVLQLCRNKNINLNDYFCAIISVCEYSNSQSVKSAVSWNG